MAQFDLRNTQSCTDTLQGLLQAYFTIITGNQRVELRFDHRWTYYNKANADALREMYQTLYAQCPHAATAGLPNLNPGNKVRRGAPMRGFNTFPRL